MTAISATIIERPEMRTLDVGQLVQEVIDGRKEGLLNDCARLVAVHYGKMIESLSALDGRTVLSHNNKTLFLEGLDIWCRALFSPASRAGDGQTEDPKEVIARVMEPWYEAMELEDPSQYRIGLRRPPPLYIGPPEKAQAVMLAMCAVLDIVPIHLRFGIRDGRPERMWGRVQADGRWYDTDISEAGYVLGDYPQYPKYEDVEVPL